MKDLGSLVTTVAGGLLIFMYLLAVLNSKGKIFDYSYADYDLVFLAHIMLGIGALCLAHGLNKNSK